MSLILKWMCLNIKIALNAILSRWLRYLLHLTLEEKSCTLLLRSTLTNSNLREVFL